MILLIPRPEGSALLSFFHFQLRYRNFPVFHTITPLCVQERFHIVLTSHSNNGSLTPHVAMSTFRHADSDSIPHVIIPLATYEL